MITISPRECIIRPDQSRLPVRVTVRFTAFSSEPGGEPAMVTYDLGDGSTVLIGGARTPGTHLTVTKQVGSGSTDVSHDLNLHPKPGESPCGDLHITVVVENTAGEFQDQILCQLRIPC